MSNSESKEKVKAIYISDVHIGSKYCQCEKVLEFLSRYDFEELYLVGDIIDIDAIKRNRKWANCYSRFIKTMIDYGKVCSVKYIPGNHDDFLRGYAGECIQDLCIVNEHKIDRPSGSILLIHGDELESKLYMRSSLYWGGSFIYDYLLFLNKKLCDLGWICGLSRLIKKKTKNVLNHITNFEEKAIARAHKEGCSKIIVGHIHTPHIRQIDNITYCNCGDWVENCCGLVEDMRGQMRIDFFDR